MTLRQGASAAPIREFLIINPRSGIKHQIPSTKSQIKIKEKKGIK